MRIGGTAEKLHGRCGDSHGKDDKMHFAKCRFCGKKLTVTFTDLGITPLSNSFISLKNLYRSEVFYPLHAMVCEECLLVQVIDVQTPKEIFSEYAYFSSYSDSWLNHAKEYAQMIISKLMLGRDSNVIEIASNDGYLLQYFNEYDILVLGIEPAANVAACAAKKGVPTIVDFFGVGLANKLAKGGQFADLIIGNNVLAHVPDINDFVEGMRRILAPGGTITLEFPHLLKLIEGNQFDTIYHEHFSYISLLAAIKIFKAHDLCIYDVEEIPTHGGSLRIYVGHFSDTYKKVSSAVDKVLSDEINRGLNSINVYKLFAENVKRIKYSILELLISLKQDGKVIVGYGAPAKGNTLLNYCGIRTDFISFTVDRNPYKQGKYLPGTHIPILDPDKIKETKPEYVFVMPWNIKDEIIQQLEFIREWGGKFIIPIPEIEVI